RVKNIFVCKRAHIRWLVSVMCMLFLLAPAAAQKPASSQGEGRYASLDGARVYYKSYGKGNEALVLIHGWSCNIDYWRDQIPDFAKRNRLIAIDLPGHGQSDKPEIAYTMDLFARAVDAVLRDAGVERAVLAGHSMGTPIARQFYRKYPKKTLGLVAVDGALRTMFPPAQAEQLVARFNVPDFNEAIGRFVDGLFTDKTP